MRHVSPALLYTTAVPLGLLPPPPSNGHRFRQFQARLSRLEPYRYPLLCQSLQLVDISACGKPHFTVANAGLVRQLQGLYPAMLQAWQAEFPHVASLKLTARMGRMGIEAQPQLVHPLPPPPAPEPVVVEEAPQAWREPCLDAAPFAVRAKAVVSRLANCQAADLEGGLRQACFILPRQLAIYLCFTHTNAKHGQIARQFGGRDRSTITYSIQKIGELLAANDPQATKLAHQARLALGLVSAYPPALPAPAAA